MQISKAKVSEATTVHEPIVWRKLMVWVFVVVATLGLVGLSVVVHTTTYLPIDLAAAHAVQSINAGWYNFLMIAVGEPGYPPQVYGLVVIIIGGLWLAGLRWEAVAEVFATVGIGVVGLVVKMLVNRPRPTADLVHVLRVLDNGKMSFPAGHVESYVAILGFLWFLAFVYAKNPWLRGLALLVIGEMIAIIGISRVYTGEHWLTDSIGGYLLGGLWLVATVAFYNWGKPRFFVTKERRR